MFCSSVLFASCLFALSEALTQERTNGASQWGTLHAANLPQFFESNQLLNGRPWGTKTCNNSNPYHEAPDIGITQHCHLTLSRAPLSPDGYLKDLLLINNQFRRPQTEANWGDWIEGILYNITQATKAVDSIQLNIIALQMTHNISGPEERECASLAWPFTDRNAMV